MFANLLYVGFTLVLFLTIFLEITPSLIYSLSLSFNFFGGPKKLQGKYVIDKAVVVVGLIFHFILSFILEVDINFFSLIFLGCPKL